MQRKRVLEENYEVDSGKAEPPMGGGSATVAAVKPEKGQSTYAEV